LLDDPEISEALQDEAFKKKLSACYADPNLALAQAETDPRMRKIFDILMKKQKELVTQGKAKEMPMPSKPP
jgi:hypothetical protein